MNPLAINWPLSSMTGYGIYGLQTLLHYLRRGGKEFALTDHIIQPIHLPRSTDARLYPLLEKAAQNAVFLDEHPKEILAFNGPMLHGVGNCYATFRNQYRAKGRPNIGCAAIEEAICPPDWLPFLKIYDRFIAISQWNADYLASLDLHTPVNLCYQGIDTNLFYPAPRINVWPGRFLIFSGGKFEFRKGQDIVVAAFRRFREKHPDALLITAWQNGHAVDAAPFAAAGHCITTPALDKTGTRLDIGPWLQEQGLPDDSFIDLGFQHNDRLPEILHGCDIAIFPNRCEGGTNLVAMETLACGVPTYVAENTGQKDLIAQTGCAALRHQKPVQSTPGIMSVTDWGESEVDEVVAALEEVYHHPKEARAKAAASAEVMKGWNWPAQSEKLLGAVYGADWPKA